MRVQLDIKMVFGCVFWNWHINYYNLKSQFNFLCLDKQILLSIISLILSFSKFHTCFYTPTWQYDTLYFFNKKCHFSHFISEFLKLPEFSNQSDIHLHIQAPFHIAQFITPDYFIAIIQYHKLSKITVIAICQSPNNPKHMVQQDYKPEKKKVRLNPVTFILTCCSSYPH